MAIVVLLAAACSHKPEMTPEQVMQKNLAEYQAEIRKIVKDSSRAEQLVAKTDELVQVSKGLSAQYVRGKARLDSLNVDYGSTRAQYAAVLSDLRGQRREAEGQLIALRQQMAALTTDEEWEQLKKIRLQMLDASLSVLQP
jgi:uncharacterized protein YdcH (DUF465 family)